MGDVLPLAPAHKAQTRTVRMLLAVAVANVQCYPVQGLHLHADHHKGPATPEGRERRVVSVSVGLGRGCAGIAPGLILA